MANNLCNCSNWCQYWEHQRLNLRGSYQVTRSKNCIILCRGCRKPSMPTFPDSLKYLTWTLFALILGEWELKESWKSDMTMIYHRDVPARISNENWKLDQTCEDQINKQPWFASQRSLPWTIEKKSERMLKRFHEFSRFYCIGKLHYGEGAWSSVVAVRSKWKPGWDPVWFK